jgi:hypothetical protein
MIFGVGPAKFVGTGTPDSNSFTLDYSTIEPTWSNPRIIEHKSAINGKKNWKTLGDYSSFMVTLNLYKYTDPTSTFNTLMTYYHQIVYFYPHSDGITLGDGLGKPIQESSSNVGFFINSIKIYYLDQINAFGDLVDVEFIASDYFNITESVQ